MAERAKVRVYAIQGAPRQGTRLPGILHIHGGGQTASLDWVRYWVKRGYVCVSFDFCGPWEKRTEFTDWGPVKHANMAQAAGGLQLRPTPRASSWYHWAVVARRALTLLAHHAQVDRGRLGIFGVSVGGSLTWMVAGSDRRVTTAVPIYGCGYNYDRRNARWDLLVPNDVYNQFQRVSSPEAHAPLVECPVLFLSATNDFHGLMDRAYNTLGAVGSGPAYCAFTPRTDHHVEPREGRNLALWMDRNLKRNRNWPAQPQLVLMLGRDGLLEATVRPLPEVAVGDIDVYYALGDKRPQARFWRLVPGSRAGDHWRASLPVLDIWDDVYAFANVTYEDGVCLSTPLQHAIPAQLHSQVRHVWAQPDKAQATLTWEPVLGAGADSWKFLGGYTDPLPDWTHLTYGRDPVHGPFAAFDTKHLGATPPVQLYTHILGDPQFQGRPGQALVLTVRGSFTAAGLTIALVEQDRSLHARRYVTAVPAGDLGPGWREVTLPLERFEAPDKRHPARWQDVDKLEVRGQAAPGEPVQFARLRWAAVPDRSSHP